MKLRPMTNSDDPAVLELNSASVDALSPLSMDRLDWLRSIASHAATVEVDGAVVGFVLTFAPGAAYDSPNFGWFAHTYGDRFLYLDRIVIGKQYRRQGLGSKVYRAVENAAVPFGRLVCEVDVEPPNKPSLAFHADRGFHEVGRLAQSSGKTCVMLSKELGAG